MSDDTIQLPWARPGWWDKARREEAAEQAEQEREAYNREAAAEAQRRQAEISDHAIEAAVGYSPAAVFASTLSASVMTDDGDVITFDKSKPVGDPGNPEVLLDWSPVASRSALSAAPSRAETAHALLDRCEQGRREWNLLRASWSGRDRAREIARLEHELGDVYGYQPDPYAGREITRDRGLYGGGTGDW